MNAVPFFLLLGRASVFWIGIIYLFAVSMIVAGIATPGERLGLYLDAVFFANFAFPACAGWLANAATQDLQCTTFAANLPGVRPRIASGFLIAGLAVSVVVSVAIALTTSTSQSLPLLFVVALGAYCLGGMLLDPLSSWITSLNVVVTVFLIVSSRGAGRFTGQHPWLTLAICLAIGLACFYRLFARSTFRLRPARPTSPVLPGRFSLEKGRRVELHRRLRDATRRGWRPGYLGHDTWRWVRAAVYEIHGFRGPKTVLKSIGRAWGLGILVLLYTWLDKGELGYGTALARSVYDALFRSPHQPQFGEHGGPFQLVALVIAAVGVLTALFAAVAFSHTMVYPLSRRQRARVMFRGGLVDAAIFLFVVSPCLFAIGHLAGWFAGYEIRLDFMPFFFRVTMVTLILIPLAHRGRLALQAATRRKSDNTAVGMIFGVAGFVLAVCAVTFLSPRLFGPPAMELVALTAAFLLSQLLYRSMLTSYFRTADLA